MSQWLDQIKHNMQAQLTKVYKDARTKAQPNEWNEFEAWFWKIRPHLDVDLAKYRSPSPNETTGPNRPKSGDSAIINIDKKDSEISTKETVIDPSKI